MADPLEVLYREDIPAGGIDLMRTAARHYLAARRSELRALTLRAHRYTLESLTGHLDGMALRAVRPHHIQDWMAVHTWATSTTLSRLSTVRQFFSWCTENGLCKTNPGAGADHCRRPRSTCTAT